MMGKLDQAAAKWEEALALAPDHANTLACYGELLKVQGKLSQAAVH